MTGLTLITDPSARSSGGEADVRPDLRSGDAHQLGEGAKVST
jgi:hypothetical protein